MTVAATIETPSGAPAGWWRAAACRGADPGPWFAGRGESTAPARAVCAGCPVRAECLDYALRHRITIGVWGGVSERGRARLRRSTSVRSQWQRKDPETIPHGTLPRYRRGCRCDGCRRANTTQSGRVGAG